MRNRILLFTQCLALLCASSVAAQVGTKVGSPKPNAPVNKTPTPTKAPTAFPDLPNLTVRDIKNLAFDSSTKQWRLEAQVANNGEADSPATNVGVKIEFVGGTSSAIRPLSSLHKGSSTWIQINLELGSFTGSKLTLPPVVTLVRVIADPRFKYKQISLGGTVTQIIFLKPDDPGLKDLSPHDQTIRESVETDNELALRPEQLSKPKH